MRHERIDINGRACLSRDLAALAANAEDPWAFPAVAFDLLRAKGFVGSPLLAPGAVGKLLRLLADIGRGDLNVGRIFEGHVNALLLIATWGSSDQQARYQDLADEGKLFGVWNTDAPGQPLRLQNGILSGEKNFASGIDGLDQAIVTITTDEGRQMIVAPTRQLSVDRSWWKPMGMKASGSHIASFDGLVVDPAWMLGPGDAYIRQPWFSGGAIRFAAVQAGGMHAVFDVAIDHLRRTGRDGDPHQIQRIARMGIAVETAYLWLDRAAEAWMTAAKDPGDASAERLMATGNATRTVIEANAMAVLEDAERAVGAAGFITPHPLERLIRDLRTYLRQPNPDGASASLGAAITGGGWTPGET